MAKRSETLELIIKAKEVASKEFKKVNSLVAKGKEGLKKYNEVAKAGQGTMNGLRGTITKLAAAFVSLQALSRVTTIIKSADQALFNMTSSVNAANREFENIGTIEEWEGAVTRLSEELRIYSESSLRDAISRTVDMTKRLGLSKEQMEEVIKRSADLGAGKTDLTGAIERVTAALRGEAEASEYLGLTLNENFIIAWYKARGAMQGAWKDLNDIQKAHIRYQVFLEQSNEMQGRAADSANTFGGAIQLVKKEIEDAIVKNKDVTSAMKSLAGTLRDNAGEIGEFASKLVSGVAAIIEFGVKYKEMLLIIAGTLVSVIIVGRLVTIIKALTAALSFLLAVDVLDWLTEVRIALAAATVQAGVLTTAFKFLLPAAAAYSVVAIGNLIKILWDWRQAAQKVKEAQADLASQKEWVSAGAKDQLAEISEEIGRTISSIDELLRLEKEGVVVFDQASQQWVKAQQKSQEAIKASTSAIKAFEEAAKKAYDAAIQKADEYARKVIEWEEKIKYARMSTEDKIRALKQKGMTDENAWYDKKRQAEEKLSAAKEALINEDYKLAEKLAKDAESLYAGLATEIKNADGSGIAKALDQTIKAASEGITEVGKFTEELYTRQKDAAKNMEDQYRDSAAVIKSGLDDIVHDREAKIEITLDGLEAAKSSVENWINDPATKTIYIKTVEKKATGGRVLGMATGGRFPGDSKQDSLWVRARPGEGFVRNEALSVWDRLLGPGFFEGINAPWSAAGRQIKAAMSGNITGFSIPAPNAPSMAFATGGRVSPPDMGMKDMGKIDINIGNKTYPVMGGTDVIEELKSALVREKLMRSN